MAVGFPNRRQEPGDRQQQQISIVNHILKFHTCNQIYSKRLNDFFRSLLELSHHVFMKFDTGNNACGESSGTEPYHMTVLKLLIKERMI